MLLAYSMPNSNTLRFQIWIVCVVCILVGMPAWFFLLRGSRILDSDPVLFTGWIVLSGLILAIWYLLKTTPEDAIKLKPGRSQWVIMIGAVWLHVNAIVWLVPGLSDDVLRYRRDGQSWSMQVSPYARSLSLPPFKEMYALVSNEWFSRDFKHPLDPLDARLHHWSMRTIYLPTAEAVFAGVWKLEHGMLGWSLIPPEASPRWRESMHHLSWIRQVLVWRIAFGLMTLAATWLLMRTAIRMDRSPWWAVLIGWHPLAIIETSGMAHQDALGVMLLAGAFLAWIASGSLSLRERVGVRGLAISEAIELGERPLPSLLPGGEGTRHALEYSTLSTRRFDWHTPAAGVLLALACGVKPLAIFAAAFWFIARPSKRWVGPFVLTGLLLASVFLYQDGYVGFLQTLRTYTQTWEANGSLFHVIRTQLQPVWIHGWWMPAEWFFVPWDFARMVGATIVAGVAIALVRKRAHWTTAYYWLVLVSLLVAPVVYPWYLLWLLVIVPILNPRWGLTGLVFAATVTFNYRLWHETQWVMPWSFLAAEYLPVYAAMIVEVGLSMNQKQSEPQMNVDERR